MGGGGEARREGMQDVVVFAVTCECVVRPRWTSFAGYGLVLDRRSVV